MASAASAPPAPSVVVDDHSLSRVPASARYGWFQVAVQRFGQISALSQFLLGATLGFGMGFWEAFWAITLGAVILEIVSVFVGIIGMREGLNTSVIARWTGFGKAGSALVGLAIGLSLIGWFGIQSGVSAAGLVAILPVLPAWAWSLVFGLLVTAIVLRGFHSMQWLANITVPLFLVLVGWAVVVELSQHSIAELAAKAPAGPELSFVAGTTLVAGGFIVGAVITPDMTRFNRSVGDVVKQTALGVTLGEYVIGLAGVLLAHAVGSSDITRVITSSVGWVGILVILLGTFKINDWNIYSSSLGVTNFIDVVFGRKVNRGVVTLVLGIVGSVLAAVGFLDAFTPFLIVLGVVFPPIAGIMIAEYFVVQRWRRELSESEGLPATSPTWVPATLVIWAVAALVGYFVAIGIPSINSVVIAFVLYVIAGKAGWVRGVGVSRTEDAPAAVGDGTTSDAPAAAPAPAPAP
ncbi:MULTISPECIES: purine-cytosine permease family protein [unclassified Curtobacterium]|uniref:purine-cytosine permease family protein n=1 Tax=unclassified Curtobacterium TaxID=257496 RepID=UPI001AE31C04|nr:MULTISPECIES: cytosine permease [unclassified Curtobacterium]MBP1302808.1 cytosine permease [Curtobacterium sp. 1310]MDB6427998.1 cytosine permease [Curtobacterium sp. 20TX0008]